MRLCMTCERYKHSVLFGDIFCLSCEQKPLPELPKKTLRQLTYSKSDSLKQYICDYLKSRGCEHCAEHDVRVLEFDHKQPECKSYNVSEAVGLCHSITGVKKELDKCRILCANCHRRVTSESIGSFKHRYFYDGLVKSLKVTTVEKGYDFEFELKELGFV